MDRTQEELERRIFYLSALNDLGKEIGPLIEEIQFTENRSKEA